MPTFKGMRRRTMALAGYAVVAAIAFSFSAPIVSQPTTVVGTPPVQYLLILTVYCYPLT